MPKKPFRRFVAFDERRLCSFSDMLLAPFRGGGIRIRVLGCGKRVRWWSLLAWVPAFRRLLMLSFDHYFRTHSTSSLEVDAALAIPVLWMTERP